MRNFLYNIARFIGYTILIEDTIMDWDTWEIKKYTHISVYKYVGRFKHDNSIKMKRVWNKKIR